jgi:subtilisin family serine protease
MILGLCFGPLPLPARAADPLVPIGQDPGGAAIAVISTGIDYTHPEAAKKLARDGEGEIIAWDFADGDNRPFDGDHQGFGNLMVELFSATNLRMIPIRVHLGEPEWLHRAASFAQRTPAAAIVLPMANIPAEIANIKAVAQQFPKLSFVVVPRSDATEAVKAAITGVHNAGVLAEGLCNGFGGAREAVEAIGSRMCQPSAETGSTGFRFAE